MHRRRAPPRRSTAGKEPTRQTARPAAISWLLRVRGMGAAASLDFSARNSSFEKTGRLIAGRTGAPVDLEPFSIRPLTSENMRLERIRQDFNPQRVDPGNLFNRPMREGEIARGVCAGTRTVGAEMDSYLASKFYLKSRAGDQSPAAGLLLGASGA